MDRGKIRSSETLFSFVHQNIGIFFLFTWITIFRCCKKTHTHNFQHNKLVYLMVSFSIDFFWMQLTLLFLSFVWLNIQPQLKLIVLQDDCILITIFRIGVAISCYAQWTHFSHAIIFNRIFDDWILTIPYNTTHFQHVNTNIADSKISHWKLTLRNVKNQLNKFFYSNLDLWNNLLITWTTTRKYLCVADEMQCQ